MVGDDDNLLSATCRMWQCLKRRHASTDESAELRWTISEEKKKVVSR